MVSLRVGIMGPTTLNVFIIDSDSGISAPSAISGRHQAVWCGDMPGDGMPPQEDLSL